MFHFITNTKRHQRRTLAIPKIGSTSSEAADNIVCFPETTRGWRNKLYFRDTELRLCFTALSLSKAVLLLFAALLLRFLCGPSAQKLDDVELIENVLAQQVVYSTRAQRNYASTV